MIKFFRKIRQRLLSENKFSKYLLYAIGEIILVMIGILLALQVSNWNEDRKIKKLEEATLKELKANLLADVEDFEENIKFHTYSMQSAEIVLEALKNKTPFHDSLSKHMATIPINPIFLPTTSAYQNLKTRGFDLITNDSLRRDLQLLYEARYTYIAKLTEIAYDYDYHEFGKMYRKEMSEYRWLGEARPVDYNSLLENQEFANLISHKRSHLRHQIIPNYKGRIKRIKAILPQIDKELEKY